MNIVRDILDKQVVDRDGRPMGRCDSVTITFNSDGPPRLTAVVIGTVPLGNRLAPRIGRWMAAFERWIGTSHARPVAVPFEHIRRQGLSLVADVQARDTAAMVVEQTLQRWLARIPGSR